MYFYLIYRDRWRQLLLLLLFHFDYELRHKLDYNAETKRMCNKTAKQKTHSMQNNCITLSTSHLTNIISDFSMHHICIFEFNLQFNIY